MPFLQQHTFVIFHVYLESLQYFQNPIFELNVDYNTYFLEQYTPRKPVPPSHIQNDPRIEYYDKTTVQ